MRVLDLLILLSDQSKNLKVWLAGTEKPQLLGELTITTVNEQRQLLLHPKSSGNPPRVWELQLQLADPDYRQCYLYLEENGQSRPVFGFQITPAGLVIN